MIISDNISAKGLKFSEIYNIDSCLIDYSSFENKDKFEQNLLNKLKNKNIELICLAGFMRILSSEFINSSKDKDSYFLNFSDGMPMFGNKDIDYHHDNAINHTKKMVKEIRNRGIKVLSYFVSDSNWGRENDSKAFNRMYGKDAEYIDVTSVLSVSKTMNKKFLQK